MRITLAQVDVRLGDLEANLATAERVIDEALEQGTDLIVFPELHISGYAVGEVDADLSMEPEDSRLIALSKRAGRAGVLLGFVEAGRGIHTYNSAGHYVDGSLLHLHRKLYLPTYSGFEERKHFTPGPSLRAYDTPHGRMATMICNDAWQPPLAFIATQDGAWVLLVPTASAQSNFPDRYDSTSYWHGITRFYGRMFQLYVVFVNRVGDESGFRFWGGSHIIDPWGDVLAEAPLLSEHVVTAEVDLGEVRRRRREIPLVKEARLGLIQREVGRLVDEGGDL